MRGTSAMKVGALVLLAIALVVAFAIYVMGFRARSSRYQLCVTFDNAQGLVGGDPVMLAGVKIGQVKGVRVNPDLKAEVTLTIDRTLARVLYEGYQFRVNNSGFIQQRMVEVLPPLPGAPRGRALQPGQCVKGSAAPDLTSLLAQSQSLARNLDRTATTINQALPQIQAELTRSLRETQAELADTLGHVAAAADAAKTIADETARLEARAGPDVLATLQNVRESSELAKQVATTLRGQLAHSEIIPNLEVASKEARVLTGKLLGISEDVSKITHNPDLQQDLTGTLADLRASAALIRKIADDMAVVTKELRKASPAIPKAVEGVSELTQTTTALRERLKPPQIDASFDVLYGPTADRTFSTGRLEFTTREGRFLRLGIDDVGEENTVDAQVGERRGGRTLRYGLIRSQLGIGLDIPTWRGATLSLDVFDPNDLRADVLFDIPWAFRRPGLGLLVGMRDLARENTFVAGVRIQRSGQEQEGP